MTLTKCPRCELNYILDGEQYCKICRMEMKGEPVRDEIEMCTVCGEHPVMPGKDVCLCCYKEMSGEENNDDTEARTSPYPGRLRWISIPSAPWMKSFLIPRRIPTARCRWKLWARKRMRTRTTMTSMMKRTSASLGRVKNDRLCHRRFAFARRR